MKAEQKYLTTTRKYGRDLSRPQLEETEIKLFNRKERKVRKTNRICTGEFQTRPLRFVTFVPPR
jgi:hypothetical protein